MQYCSNASVLHQVHTATTRTLTVLTAEEDQMYGVGAQCIVLNLPQDR